MVQPSVVHLLDWNAARDEARRVREEVFVREQGVPIEMEWDEWDERCVHALAVDQAGRAVGTGRLLPDGRIGRMAVLRTWRGRGVGTAILEALMQPARQQDMPAITLHAQTHAAAFYGRYGFSAVGEIFMEAGIPHVTMTLRLSSGPA